ncbi:tyrosine-type recombinase/integrase [Synechococcus elongatus]|uniref:tyrosine-type recombinase/integrase n=1 Tax=Synechococcus elongatus TaxID=32046 RepID=UPI000F7F71A8|nr:tyrosine-type recombinase/integrase [Synechococcus elongatus]
MSRQWYPLGIPAIPSRLREAKIKALALSEDIRFNRFQWPSDRQQPGIPRTEALSQVEDEFRRLNRGVESTWRYIYKAHYDQLRNLDRLTLESLYQYCDSKPAGSRSRQTAITAMRFLAQVMGWSFSVEKVKTAERRTPTAPRILPSDRRIEEMWEQTANNPRWQLVIGLMATFGLRNHEVFTCDLKRFQSSDEPFVEVLKGKSGFGRAYAFPLEWIERFNLRQGDLPEISQVEHIDIGNHVTRWFRRRGYGRAYDLRHAYAIRMMTNGVPLDVAAKWMRHSVRVHTQVYQAWIDQQRMDEVYARLTGQD